MDAKSGRTSSDALVAFLNTLMTTRESRSIEELPFPFWKLVWSGLRCPGSCDWGC